MMRPLMCVMLASLASAACGAAADDLKLIFFEPHPYMSKEVMLEGCALWAHTGARCVEAATENEANHRVTYAPGACGEWYGTGGPKGVSLVADCFLNPDGTLDAHGLKIVFAHEIGHSFGVAHVPTYCEPDLVEAERLDIDPSLKLVRHPDGELVCGEAIMNPRVPVHLDAATRMDDLAFDLRDVRNAATHNQKLAR